MEVDGMRVGAMILGAIAVEALDERGIVMKIMIITTIMIIMSLQRLQRNKRSAILNFVYIAPPYARALWMMASFNT
jgi:16S rRNA G966 N2-methylase RsmD